MLWSSSLHLNVAKGSTSCMEYTTSAEPVLLLRRDPSVKQQKWYRSVTVLWEEMSSFICCSEAKVAMNIGVLNLSGRVMSQCSILGVRQSE